MNRFLAATAAVVGLFVLGVGAVRAGEAREAAEPSGLAAAVAIPALNQKLLTYAKSNLGKKVGNGECTTLVNTGYEAVGARRDPPFGPNVDYIWGTPITAHAKVLPGDVIQFRDAVFQSRKKQSNGTILIYTFRLPHHTAIVSEVRNSGAGFVVLNQNSSDSTMAPASQLTVKNSFIKMAELKSGKLWFYRPIAK